MKVVISAIGSVVAAFFSAVCCVGPLVFAALGVGAGATGFFAGTAQAATALVPYRPLFVGLTFLLLGLGLFSLYRRTRACAADSTCPAPSIKRTKRFLWAATGTAILLVLMPYLLALGN